MINKHVQGKTWNMRLCSSSILIFTCFTGIVFYPSAAAIGKPAPKILEIAQASTPESTPASILSLGAKGSDVELLQTQLKELGYYNGVVNGEFDEKTKSAVAKFQQAKGLNGDGKAGKATRETLQAAVKAKNPVISFPTPTPLPKVKPKPAQRSFLLWLIVGTGVLGSIGLLIILMRWFSQRQQVLDSETAVTDNPEPLPELDSTRVPQEHTLLETNSKAVTPPAPLLPIEKTSRLAKVNIVDELIKDLRSPDPAKRNKAIWDLGQQGDSRAIQPLIDLMIDADSQQHGLMLAALAEIGIRTLKPMNRALAISMEDENPQVRQNAIRDLTRIYDIIGQMSQILRYAAEDSDPEVQATAKYALNHLHRIRGLPKNDKSPEDGE